MTPDPTPQCLCGHARDQHVNGVATSPAPDSRWYGPCTECTCTTFGDRANARSGLPLWVAAQSTPQPAHDHGAAGFCAHHAQGEQGWVTHRWANKAARHTADETCPGCPTPSTPQPAPDERTETVARVLLDHQPGVRLDNDSETPDHPDVTGTCWCGWETRPELFAWRRREQHRAHQAATIVAALDDETARLRAAMETLIRDLDTGRADGTIYTYGQIQRRLRAALDPEEPR